MNYLKVFAIEILNKLLSQMYKFFKLKSLTLNKWNSILIACRNKFLLVQNASCCSFMASYIIGIYRKLFNLMTTDNQLSKVLCDDAIS